MAQQIYTVGKGQTLIDVALQVYGSSQYLYQLATDNGLTVDADVTVGQELIYDDSIGQTDVKNKITTNNIYISNE